MSYGKGVLGADLLRRTTYPEYKLGTTERFADNLLGVYVRASEAVAVGTCTVNGTTFALTDTAGLFTADAAFATNEYGWVKRTVLEVAYA